MNRVLTFGRLGGVCSVLLGVTYAVFGISYLLDPSVKATSQVEFFTVFAQNPTMYLLGSWSIAFGALIALAVIPAVGELVESSNMAWVRWASNLAYVGFAMTALVNFSVVVDQPAKAAGFMEGDAMTRAAVLAPYFAIDPRGWFPLGCVGMWLLVVNVLALRSGAFPRGLAWLGIVGGGLYWLALAGNLMRFTLLFAIGAGVGGILLAPIYFIWLGLVLRKRASVNAVTANGPAPVAYSPQPVLF
jgi:phage-related holin